MDFDWENEGETVKTFRPFTRDDLQAVNNRIALKKERKRKKAEKKAENKKVYESSQGETIMLGPIGPPCCTTA